MYELLKHKPRHGKLTGIANEAPKWREVPIVCLVYGVPFALTFATIWTIIF